MRRIAISILVAFALILPAAAIVPVPQGINLTEGSYPPPPSLTIIADPSEAEVGDTIILNGTVTGIDTIAVYLYLTGPGLDPRGVALENLNIAAGRGLFTTAPVKMSDGTWTYEWDTSIIIGTLDPGKYTVHVVASPLDRLRSNPQESATVDIMFCPSENPPSQTPLPPLVPVVALFLAGMLFTVVMRRE